MNEAQKAAIRSRQQRIVGAEPAERGVAPTMPVAPLQPFEEIVEAMRPDVGPGIPVARLRFNDRSFQVAGMQSDENLEAKRHPNGREHRIELVTVGGTSCFLITFIEPSRRLVEFDLVERSSVKTWRLAPVVRRDVRD